MTEAEVIHAMRHHLEGLFPRLCPNCQRRFESLREYLQVTTHQGPPMSYDAELGRWKPLRPLGTMTLANCTCGSTLALTSQGIPLFKLWRMLNWARIETKRRAVGQQHLLGCLRDEICRQVLAEPSDRPAGVVADAQPT